MSRRCDVFAVLFGLVAAALLCLAGPALAGAERAAEQALQGGVSAVAVGEVERGVESGQLSAADASALLAVVETACREGLLAAPFEDKLLEGLAKRVPPQAVLGVLQRKLAHYRRAAELLGGRNWGQNREVGPAPAVVAAMGEALSEGVDVGAFEDVLAAYHDQDPQQLEVGLEMFSLLCRAGFDPALSRTVLDAGFSSGGLTPEWRYLVQVVLVARQRGIADRDVADAAAAVLAAGGDLGEVPPRLGFTHRDLRGSARQHK